MACCLLARRIATFYLLASTQVTAGERPVTAPLAPPARNTSFACMTGWLAFWRHVCDGWTACQRRVLVGTGVNFWTMRMSAAICGGFHSLTPLGSSIKGLCSCWQHVRTKDLVSAKLLTHEHSPGPHKLASTHTRYEKLVASILNLLEHRITALFFVVICYNCEHWSRSCCSPWFAVLIYR
jgi:hypothetical protein